MQCSICKYLYIYSICIILVEENANAQVSTFKKKIQYFNKYT